MAGDLPGRSIEYADLSWPQAEALLSSPRKPVLLFPVGATEPHGPHAPLSTDMVISPGMCRRAAATPANDLEICALSLPPRSESGRATP